MRHNAYFAALLAAMCLIAAPAHAQTDALSPLVRLFSNLPFVTDFFGYLFLILRNWIVFATIVFPVG